MTRYPDLRANWNGGTIEKARQVDNSPVPFKTFFPSFSRCGREVDAEYFSSQAKQRNKKPIIEASGFMKQITSIFCISLLSNHLNAGIVSITATATSTLTSANSSQTQTNTTQFVIPANVAARVLHLHDYYYTYSAPGTLGGSTLGSGGYMIIQVNNLNFKYTESTISQVNNQPIIAGPATIKLIALATCNTSGTGSGISYNASVQDNMVCTIETNLVTLSTNLFTPNTGVVIPADAGGPVNIILESSVDLINWTPADPGTYGTTTTNRFFRVRASR